MISKCLVSVVAVSTLGLTGCAAMKEWMPTLPAPSMTWLIDPKKPGPLPELTASATASISWQAQVGSAGPGFSPTVLSDAIYAASQDGALVRLDPANGRSVWRVDVGQRLSAGVGADATLVIVGGDKGDVFAYFPDGKPAWKARVSTEVVAPPRIAEGVVMVFTGDGSVHALNAADGTRKWVNQRATPALIVRNFAGGSVRRGALFIGTAGGHLLALAVPTGIVGWDATVANPKGATELERIADVTSMPLVLEKDACAVAYQGRVACFDITRGTLQWSRDISSLTNMAADNKNIYLTDDKGAVHALDRSTGASVWKQDILNKRRIGGPQMVADYVGLVDVEGYLHLLSPVNGAYVGRLATDSKPATAQPELLLTGALWQSTGGTLFAVSAK
ncbi:MAG: outer membrane protein assembly factor BamB [Betaproteobacteria bacterium]